MQKKRHSPQEIEAKLRQAEKMASEGKRQAEIAGSLGISVMTYHRWRKPRLHARRAASAEPVRSEQRIADLETENARLRRVVTDLLLEKVRLEDELRARRERRRPGEKIE